MVAFSIAVPAAGATAAEAAFVEGVQGRPSALAVEHRGVLALPAAVAARAVVEVEQPAAPLEPKEPDGHARAEGTGRPGHQDHLGRRGRLGPPRLAARRRAGPTL